MADNEKKFSDTRQFSVPRNTADSLREQINRANEQSLRRKRSNGTASPGNGQGSARVVNGGQVHATNPAAVPPHTHIDPTLPGAMTHTPTSAQNPNTTHPTTAKPVSHGGAVSQVSGTSARPMLQRQTNVPTERPAQSTPRSTERSIQPQPSQPLQQNVSQKRSVERQAEVFPERQKQNSVKQTPMPRRQEALTRVTDISTIQQRTVQREKTVKKPRIQRTEVVYEGEGGNTVVSIVKAVVYMIFVVVVSIFLAIAIIHVGNDVFAFVKNDVSVDVHIPEYATIDDITNILYENEVIAYPTIFKLYANLKKDVDGFLAGDYVVSPNMNYDDLRNAFQPQPKVGISEITIPEGYTTDEIIDLMVSYGIGTREGYVDAIQNYDFDYWFLEELDDTDKDRIYRLDGYLFPDTYQFYNSSSEVTVLNKLLKRFGQIFKKEYKIQAESMGYTVDEIITLASMIEKEAGTPSEFFKVSSVFHNRLNNWGASPKLESDATIVYAIQHATGERPKLTDTSYDTPYNTYTYAGLPPGPIANPSASAILASLSPAETGYYYFVSDGNITYFSETKEQHQTYINEIKKGTIREYAAQNETAE